MSEEIKKLIQAQGDAFEEFKSTMKLEIEAVKKDEGAGTGELKTKMVNIVENYDKMKDTVDKLHADLQAVETVNRTPAEDPKLLEHKGAFSAYCRKNDPSKFQNVVQVGIDADGGYACPADVSSRISETVLNGNTMRMLATVETTSRASWEMLTDPNEMTASRIGETGTRSETTTPQIGKIEIVPREMYCYPKSTQAALDDAVWDFESWLVKKSGRGFSILERTEMASGNGVAGARGITAYTNIADASYSWGSVGFLKTGEAAVIGTTGAELVNTSEALEDEYKANASWLFNRATLTSYKLLRAGTSGANLFLFWQPSLVAGTPDTLLGFPVYKYAGMPVQASNAYIGAFGDFREAYTIVDRVGINVIRDNITSPGFVKFHVYRRSSAGITNFEALKLVKCAA